MLNHKARLAVQFAELSAAEHAHTAKCRTSIVDCSVCLDFNSKIEDARVAYENEKGDAGIERQHLQPRRRGYNQKAKCGGQKIYLRTGDYPDGTLGEFFIDVAKEGATLRGVFNCFAIAVSLGLQYGVPLQEFVDAFVGTKFEPNGMVHEHGQINDATSLVDLIFHDLALSYGAELPVSSKGRRATDA